MKFERNTRYVGANSPEGDESRRTQGASTGNLIRSMLAQPECYIASQILGLLAMPTVAGAWFWIVPICVVYSVWYFTGKYRLPFRLPMSSKAVDYSNPVPGNQRKYRRGTGLLFLGNDQATSEELWLSNDDARRHAFVLGTTGSGKALPTDTLVLTKDGWVENGELQAGDAVYSPSGRLTRISGIYPQGPLPVVLMKFADGRQLECSRDHLWAVRRMAGLSTAISDSDRRQHLQTSSDIAIQLELGGKENDGTNRIRLFAPLPSGIPGTRDSAHLTSVAARSCGKTGLGSLDFVPALDGSVLARASWTKEFLEERNSQMQIVCFGHYLEIPVINQTDGHQLRQLIWSLGGYALQIERSDGTCVRASFPCQEEILANAPPMDPLLISHGLEILGVAGLSSINATKSEERRPTSCYPDADVRESEARTRDCFVPLKKEMSCIRTDDGDGLFVAENYVVTHNTELLLGIVSQSLMWSSGFLFIDGKGTSEFHGRAWSLAKRFGREDDYRILNFTDVGGVAHDKAGGPFVQSNTLNPFSHGSSDQLMNLVVSLMGDSGKATDMWKSRAMALVTSAMKALCEMRDAGDVLLDVQSIRDYLPLGIGVKKELLGGREISAVEEVPAIAWQEMRSHGGMIELYLRALHGEFSEKSKLALKGFFDSLPGFDLLAAINGVPQQGKPAEQHGFLSMQLTKPLGSLADDFGHIFCVPFGEVDIEDIVLNRRILVVLLPALQKAPEEMQNCGRIIVALLKMMMGRAAGSNIMGSKRMLIDARPTRSPTPFIAVLDEVGYYMVKGIDIMMAQARSLGFMIVISGQDMAAMQSIAPQIAETAAANARLTVAGAMEDAHGTWSFLKKKFSSHKVAVTTGRSARFGAMGVTWVDRPDVSFVQEDRVRIDDLQRLREGEFYFLMGSTLVKAHAFYTGEHWVENISVNKFLMIRGPAERAPGLDQSKEVAFMEGLELIASRFVNPPEFKKNVSSFPHKPKDILFMATRIAEDQLAQSPIDAHSTEIILGSNYAGLLLGYELLNR